MNPTREHQQHLEWVRVQACLVKSGHKTLAQVPAQYRADAQRELETQGYREFAKTRSLVMQWQREDKERAQQRMRELRAAGCELYSPGQGEYTAVVRVHLDGCESGEYPTATKTAQAVAGDKAPKLLTKTNKKRLRRAFQENKEHPGMQRINAIADNSTITALTSGSMSNCLGALANSHKLARRLGRIESKAAELEARLFRAEEEAARANARLDLKDQGKDWKEAARAVLAAEPGISNRELARRVGVGESTVRKYKIDIKA